MPVYNFVCDCGHRWEVFRHISDNAPQKDRCPNCRDIGRREYGTMRNMSFTPYWTDGLTGEWEHIDSRSTELRREKETGMVRLPNRNNPRLSRPTEKEASYGARGN